MAVNLLAELFDSTGKKLDESFFGSFLSVKNWAKEKNATFIRVYDVEEDKETYYLKAGAQGRWTETTSKMYEFTVNRNKQAKE